MEDVKDKMKNLIKKANKPFSSSSSAFKGQAHTLGSSPSTPTINKSESDNDPATTRIHYFLSGGPAESSVETMIKLLRNVAREPGNEKFRKIRMGNPRIKAAIGDVKGGLELLECAGFRVEEEGGERWARMGELTREGIEGIERLVSLLEKWKRKDGDAGGDGGKEREVKVIDREVVCDF